MTSSDHEHVRQTSGEFIATLVLQVDNIETTRVTITVHNHTNATNVLTTADHGELAGLEGVDGLNLACLQVELNSVVDLDGGVSEADGAPIVGGSIRDSSLLAVEERVSANRLLVTLADSDNAAQLELGVLVRDALQDKAALDVVHQTKVLLRLRDGDNI